MAYIDAKQRNQARSDARVLVGSCRHLHNVLLLIVAQPRPAGALHRHGISGHLRLERLQPQVTK